MKRFILITVFFMLLCVVSIFGIQQWRAVSNDESPPVDDIGQKKISILDDAISMTRQNRETINLDQTQRLHHITAARNPVIDDMLSNPFYLPVFAGAHAARLNGSNAPVTPGSIVEEALAIIGAAPDIEPPEIPQRSLLDIFDQIQKHFQSTPLSSGTRKYYETVILSLPEGLEDALVVICGAVYQAAVLRQESIKDLTTSERHLIIDDPLLFYFDTADHDRFRFFERSPNIQLKIMNAIRKIDLRKMLTGMRLMTDAVESTRAKLEWIHKRTIAQVNGEIMLEFKSALGPILVGGPGINRYDDDAALIVDLDGSDVYLNNAGGSFPVRGGVACVIDVDGNDIYINNRPGVLGAGILGIGMLIDYYGYDTYDAGDVSIGSGLAGAGLIYDEKGGDRYRGGVLTQGAGLFGLGLAIDIDGHDFYSCDSMGQGFGGTMGTGLLVNVWGRDNYTAGTPQADLNSRNAGIAQGSGLGLMAPRRMDQISIYGGIGILADAHGNDTYSSNFYSQGSSRFLSIGCLIDSEGDDLYDGRAFSQGCGHHFSAGILVDQQGSDRYYGENTVQGSAVDNAAGFLLDYSGDDIYRHHGQNAQGHARINRAFGLFLDYAGDDRFESADWARGDILPAADPVNGPIGIFINHLGADTYYSKGTLDPDHHDNTTWHPDIGAVGVDTSAPPIMYFANQQGESSLYHYAMSPVRSLETDTVSKNSRIGSEDIFVRFHSLSALLQQKQAILPVIVKSIDIGHNEYRRMLEEAIALLATDAENPGKICSSLFPLLKSTDWRTRCFGIEMLVRNRCTDCSPELQKLITDEEPLVRTTACWALAKIKDTSSTAALQKIAIFDASASCRIAAIESLSVVACDASGPTFKEALRDPDKSVQMAASIALKLSGYREAVGTLQLLTTSDNIFLRRSSGITLLFMGQKSGFPVLINTIKYRSQDNSRESFPFDLMNVMRWFSNMDYGRNIKDWQKWWSENESGIDMSRAIEPVKRYYHLITDSEGLGHAEFLSDLKSIRSAFPEYRGFDPVIGSILYRRAREMDEQETQNIQGMQQFLQQAIQLDQQPEYFGFLAELHFRMQETEPGFKQLKAGLEVDPTDAYLLNIKAKYQKK